jgi:ribose/xylose/arabinose/galactoside ABC-type transport system permease subunit
VRSRLVRSRLIVWIWPYWQSVIRGLLMLAVVILQAKLAGSRKVG